MTSNPFVGTKSAAGTGRIHVAAQSAQQYVLRELRYQYPLKLIAPTPTAASEYSETNVHTVFILTYGGGLVAGDQVGFSVQIDEFGKLILLTQGSTKIFKSDDVSIETKQSMTVHLARGSSLCLLPDPVQPFAKSHFQQRQEYHLMGKDVNLCALDWVSQGRSARGECWDFWRYGSKNEIWRLGEKDQQMDLLIRDNLILDHLRKADVKGGVRSLGVYGTLIIGGSQLSSLSSFFIEEFKGLPRLGAKQWHDEPIKELTEEERWRSERHAVEASSGLLWTAAATRGFVVIKFGSREIEGGRRWLFTMLKKQGSLERMFGERALLCLR